jgi:hypothetical protein
MKPVVIIALSVICSVVAVLGVLVVMEMYAINEANKAVAIELERQKVCDKLYNNTGSLQDIELWGICLNYGIIESVNSDVELCGDSLSDSAGLCKTEKKLEAIRLIEREITLNQDFYKLALSQKSDLQTTKKMYAESIEKVQSDFDKKIVLEEEWVMKYTNQKIKDWNPIYQECLNMPRIAFDTSSLYNDFCENTLQKAMNQSCDYSSGTCRMLISDIMNNEPVWSNVKNIHNEQWSKYQQSCKANPYTDYKTCMCETELISTNWVRYCIDNEQDPVQQEMIRIGTEILAEEKRLEEEKAKNKELCLALYPPELSFGVSENNSKYFKCLAEGANKTWLNEISTDYSKCKGNEKYENSCYEKLKNNMEEYCKTTVGMSYPEYDECFGEITKIQ